MKKFSQKKKKGHKEKFDKLHEKQGKPIRINQRPSLIKNPVLQCQEEPLPDEAVDLLSLGPKFALTPNNFDQFKMETMNEVEKCALTLEKKGNNDAAATLRHEVAETLKKAKKPKSNLTSRQKKGLSYFKKNKALSVVPFDKGQGFSTLKTEKLTEKTEKEFKNVTLDTPNGTKSLETKIQKKLRTLHKEDKIDTATYKQLYPSGSLTPTANPVIKAHKPEKDYPVRVITSHIGAPQEALSTFLNQILQPFIEKSPHVIKNSFTFVEKIKTLTLNPNDKMISFDAAALFPSVPITDCLNHISDLLKNDQDLPRRTKLSSEEIIELISLSFYLWLHLRWPSPLYQRQRSNRTQPYGNCLSNLDDFHDG